MSEKISKERKEKIKEIISIHMEYLEEQLNKNLKQILRENLNEENSEDIVIAREVFFSG